MDTSELSHRSQVTGHFKEAAQGKTIFHLLTAHENLNIHTLYGPSSSHLCQRSWLTYTSNWCHSGFTHRLFTLYLHWHSCLHDLRLQGKTQQCKVRNTDENFRMDVRSINCMCWWLLSLSPYINSGCRPLLTAYRHQQETWFVLVDVLEAFNADVALSVPCRSWRILSREHLLQTFCLHRHTVFSPLQTVSLVCFAIPLCFQLQIATKNSVVFRHWEQSLVPIMRSIVWCITNMLWVVS